MIYHKSSFLSWKITVTPGGKQVGISCNKQAKALEANVHVLVFSLGAAPAGRGGPGAALSSALLHHPRTANSAVPCWFRLKLLGFASTASDQDLEIILETSKGTLTWKLSSLQQETKQGESFKENKRVCKTVAHFKLLIMENMALRTQDSSKSFL